MLVSCIDNSIIQNENINYILRIGFNYYYKGKIRYLPLNFGQ